MKLVFWYKLISHLCCTQNVRSVFPHKILKGCTFFQKIKKSKSRSPMKNPILGMENLYPEALFNGILIFQKILNWNFKFWILDFYAIFFWLTSEDGMNEPSYEDVRHGFGTPKSHTFSLWKSQEHPCHLRQHFVNICWPQCGPKCAEICVLGAHLTTCSQV